MRICRGEADARTLRLEALDAIRRAVGFDAYAWLLTDPETSVGSSPLADVPCLPQLPQLIRLKYATTVNRWTGLPSGAASLHGATGGRLSLSLMWRELLSRYQVTDIASSVYRDRFGCWGFLDLWRIGAPAFTAADIEFLGHIAGRSRRRCGTAWPGPSSPPPAPTSCPRARSCCCFRPPSRCGLRPRRRSATCRYSSRPRRRTRHRSRPARTTSPRNCSPPRPGWTTTRR